MPCYADYFAPFLSARNILNFLLFPPFAIFSSFVYRIPIFKSLRLHYCKVLWIYNLSQEQRFLLTYCRKTWKHQLSEKKMTDWLSFNTTGMHRLHRFRWELSQQKQQLNNFANNSHLIFIGPESDHWQCLSVTDWLTDWLTDSCLVNLIDVTLACEYVNTKLVDVVTVADEDPVGNNLLQILKLRFGKKS